MKCSNCGKEFDLEWQGKVISCDGDGVCSDKCAEEHAIKMARFIEDMCSSSEKLKTWLLSGNLPEA